MKVLRLVLVPTFFLSVLQAQHFDTTFHNSVQAQMDSLVDSSKVLPQKATKNIIALEKMAEYRGGMNRLYGFIAEKVSYPYRCMEAGIEGIVILEFVVEIDGSLSNVQTRTNHKSCPEMDAEAIRVITKTSGKWKPAYQRDKPVRSRYRLPVRFDLG